MCTVSYIPLSGNDYILTHNRDVGKNRPPAKAPDYHDYNDTRILHPTDPQGGGTWNAISDTQHAFILNGADYDYFPDFDAKKSRGSICIDILTGSIQFPEDKNLTNYDDFTLMHMPRNRSDFNDINEWRWNGSELVYVKREIHVPQFWISRGLYSFSDYVRKENAFRKLLDSLQKIKNTDQKAEKILEFHSQKEVFGEEGFLIDRETAVATVSITQVKSYENKEEMNYYDISD